MAEKRLLVLGEVNKKFVVSPNLENLLSAMEAADQVCTTAVDGENNQIRMETT
jgi:DNA-directed RNA polymerase III subunit RPC4